MPDFVYMLETRLTPEQQAAVRLVQQIARDHQMNAYLTGGSVRDLMTGFQIRDLDFSVQGNALKLQKDLEKAASVTEGLQEELRVLYMLLPGRVRAEIASTRAEKFDKPSKPEIHPATMGEDLRRRDFTSNAMALSLNEGSYALLMDPFNGVADIENKHLRILHNYSFYEEPSRMLRAVRFISRFGWAMDERTQARFDAAKENNYIDSISKAALGYELEQVVHEPDPLAAMRALEAHGYLKLLYPSWSPAKVDEAMLKRVAETRDKLASVGLNADASAANAEFLTKRMLEKDVLSMQKAMPRKGFVESWRRQEVEAKELAKRLTSKEAETPSQTWRMLMSAKPETTLFLAVTTKQSAVESKLTEFFEVWPQFRQRMPYAVMTELRITPELPIYSKLLDEMFLLMIDGKLTSEEEVRAFLQPHSPPLPAPPPSFGRRGRGKKAAKAATKKSSAKAPAAAKTSAAPAQEALAGTPALEKVATAVGRAAGTLQKAVAAVASLGKAAPAVKKIPPPAKALSLRSRPAKKAPAKGAKPTKPASRAHKVNVAAKLKRKPAGKPKPAAKPRPAQKSAKPPARPAKKKTAKRR